MNSWFRMYHEWATDPKIQMLPETYQRRYVMLLCLKCCNGDVTLQDNEVSFQLRITDEEWLDTKSLLIDRNLITKQNVPTQWDKRQFVSDSSAARVAAHRAKKKQLSNADVTLPVTKCNALDTDTDTDTDTEEKNALFNPVEVPFIPRAIYSVVSVIYHRFSALICPL